MALLLVVLGLLYALIGSAIGWFWAAKPLEVDNGALQEVTAIGTVVARAEGRYTESDSVVVTEFVVLALQARGPNEVLTAAAASLQSKSWKVTEQTSMWVQFRSQRWPNHLLTVEVPDNASFSLQGEAYENVWREAISTAQDPAALVILSLKRTDV
ncbi:hypothetical protein ACFPOI_00970 [Nonomuraea angiospora]|uniref:Uncharacterized protein n=1 Tax=Nonomuraea angiospora TaxID=46172 RepID=A0ABR9M3Q0_9ACTN|nr:hypothetical protein [Nonomuraea angiospora]MBE1586976.1 hypothetical protein [Nonomuraea angiospora]